MASVKQKIVDAISENGHTKVDAEIILSEVTQALTEALVEEGDSIRLQGFGTLSVVKRAARAGRNPRTGEALQIPEKLVIKFSQVSKK